MHPRTKFSCYNEILKNFEFIVGKIRINWATQAISSGRYSYRATAKTSSWIVLRKDAVREKMKA